MERWRTDPVSMLRNGNSVWMDRTGKRLGAISQAGAGSAALSPDEKRISFAINRPEGGADLWLHDVARGVPSRFTFRPGASTDGVWSPDGSRIVFRADDVSLYQKPANLAGNEELLFRGGVPVFPLDWSRDRKFLVLQMQSRGQTAGYDLWLLPLEGDNKPVPYLQTPFNEGDAQFSPDGRWMAYASNESGQPQIYVQAIPASGAKRQISPTGGDQPRWRRDGKELFYISADQKLMAVPVKTGTLFEYRFSAAAVRNPARLLFQSGGRFDYQPTADGQRFLVTAPVAGAATPPITVVLNWQAGLRK